METQLQLLLDKTAVIKMRVGALYSDETFNIFRILRAGHEEVMLHSRFLYELLIPKGSHGMGEVFLRLFAVVCELPTLSSDTVQVMQEYANIDILTDVTQYFGLDAGKPLLLLQKRPSPSNQSIWYVTSISK